MGQRRRLHVELEVHDVAILHHVLLALLAQAAGCLAALLAAQAHVVLVGRGLCLDEAALDTFIPGLSRQKQRFCLSEPIKKN